MMLAAPDYFWPEGAVSLVLPAAVVEEGLVVGPEPALHPQLAPFAAAAAAA